MKTQNNEALDLYAKADESLNFKIELFLEKYPEKFVFENTEFNLKAKDEIEFMGGYNNDILYKSKIFAFDSETGFAYVYWDCYWFPVDLSKKLIKINN